MWTDLIVRCLAVYVLIIFWNNIDWGKLFKTFYKENYLELMFLWVLNKQRWISSP